MEQPGYEVMADTYAELFTEAFGTPLYSCPGSGDYATRVTYLSRARAATIVASTNSTTPWPAPGAGILTLSPTPSAAPDSARSSAPSAGPPAASNTSRQFTSRRAGDRGAGVNDGSRTAGAVRLPYSVGEGGLEPPRPEGHWHLKPARLPFRHSPVAAFSTGLSFGLDDDSRVFGPIAKRLVSRDREGGDR